MTETQSENEGKRGEERNRKKLKRIRSKGGNN